MTAPYEPIARWTLPRGVVPATLRGVLRAARALHEGGAFWLGERDATATVRTVVLLEGRGITEEISFWEVSALVYGRVGDWADGHNQVLLAVVHSHHGHGATAMSGFDRRGAVHVPDVLSVIVPGFGAITDLVQWGVHRYDGRQFVELLGIEKAVRFQWTETPVTVLSASEDGVRGG